MEFAIASTTQDGRTRELALRERDCSRVVPVRHPRENAVTVSVADARTGERSELAVEGERALDAFHHPFANAA